jgi:phosphoadenosine phosphosulfate reductase
MNVAEDNIERRAAVLAWRYGRLEGEALLRPLIEADLHGRIALLCSFGTESALLLHMVARIDRATPVIFLDTGKLFGETLR